MKKELVIRNNANSIDFAILKEEKLVGLIKTTDENEFSIGDIFYAKVNKVSPGLNAAFVDLRSSKSAFLHQNDIGTKFSSMLRFIKEIKKTKNPKTFLKEFKPLKEFSKNDPIEKNVKINQYLLVQIAKEPISTKGPKITSEISLTGRYMIIIPFSDKISISHKITNIKEKNRLKLLVSSIRPKNFGIIVRTVAKNAKVAHLDTDLQELVNKWTLMCEKLYLTNRAPTKLFTEKNVSESILRDIFDENFINIFVDDKNLSIQIKNYIKHINPQKESIVKFYNENIPIFEKFNVERQIKTSFGKTVLLSKGSYLIIEHTEALHVIDVNSGNKNKSENQQDNALEVNLMAATEIARQLQLRDMGGIIVVDFIDMKIAKNRKMLFDHLMKEMNTDKATHKILPPSKFGLIQITRQRVRKETIIETKETNPNKEGQIEAPIVLIEKIETEIDIIRQKTKTKRIFLHTHPFVAAYLKKGFFSIRRKWAIKYRRKIKIIPRDSFTYLEYSFLDKNQKLIQ